MRIAYCMLVHKNPEQVTRLIGRLYSSSDYFYIHKDRGKPWQGWEYISQQYPNENVVIRSKYRTPMGTFGLVEATLDGMNCWRSFDYDYFIHLSGQCYPIKPLSVIKEELGRKNVAYMEYFKLPSRIHWMGENGGLDRINFLWVRLGGHDIRMHGPKRKLPYDLEPYGGSHYFFLPKRFVDYVLDYVSAHPKIIRFYRYTRIPEELFFQTIIMNSPLRSDVVNTHTRYLHGFGDKAGAHPAILVEKDFTDIARSEKLFAKKFDVNVDRNILDLIDTEIDGAS